MSELRDGFMCLVHEQWADWEKYQREGGEKRNAYFWADRFIDLIEEWKEESSIKVYPTWQVIISDNGNVYTIEAEGYHIMEDGSLQFYKVREGGGAYPVGVVAPLSWILARRIR